MFYNYEYRRVIRKRIKLMNLYVVRYLLVCFMKKMKLKERMYYFYYSDICLIFGFLEIVYFLDNC